ncbi:MAG: extracellular solute-binding protein [Dehalococcoidia bacterium]
MNQVRRFTYMSVLVLACLLVTACGSGDGEDQADTGGEEEAAAEPVSLELWWWGDQEAAGAEGWMDETIELFEADNAGVTINAELQTTDGLIPAFKAAASAQEGPDIQYFWGGVWSVGDAWEGNIVPVSDYIDAEELDHYLNTEESTYEGQIWTAPWYVNPSFPVLARTDVLSEHGLGVPETWDQLLEACGVLSEAGVPTIAGGIKDGWFGGWLYSLVGSQGVVLDDVFAAVLGEQSFTDPAHLAYWERLQELRDNDCFNDDINSVELYQGQQQWSSGEAAMTIVAGSDVRKFLDEVDADVVEVLPMPVWGDGEYAGKLGSTSQTVGITSWSEHPEIAADFIVFMHTEERRQAWFEQTGAFPADDRFDPSVIDSRQLSSLFDMVVDGSPYIENFIPPELDADAIFSQSQLLLAGDVDAAEAAANTEEVAQRLRETRPDIVENFGGWADSYR